VELTDINRTVCCYAEQDKTWAHDPAGAPWEIYTVTDDLAEAPLGELMMIDQVGGNACCSTSDAGTAVCC